MYISIYNRHAGTYKRKIREYNTLSNSNSVAQKDIKDIKKDSEQQKHQLDASNAFGRGVLKNDRIYFDQS